MKKDKEKDNYQQGQKTVLVWWKIKVDGKVVKQMLIVRSKSFSLKIQKDDY